MKITKADLQAEYDLLRAKGDDTLALVVVSSHAFIVRLSGTKDFERVFDLSVGIRQGAPPNGMAGAYRDLAASSIVGERRTEQLRLIASRPALAIQLGTEVYNRMWAEETDAEGKDDDASTKPSAT